MKKFISLLLTVCMLVSMSSTAVDADTSTTASAPTTSVSSIDGGHMYIAIRSDANIAILTNDEDHLIDISISYLSLPNTVYQWTITDYPESTFSTADSFWSDVIAYAENRMANANIVTFTEVSYDEPIELPQTRSSAGADLLEDLESFLETGEYFGDEVYSTTYQGQDFRILESMDFRILTNGSKSWSTTISVSSLIVSVLGLAATSTLVGTICSVFGVTLSAASLIPPGKINKYICRAMNYRYVSINGSEYAYSMADKFIDYNGYENADNNSSERAYADSGSKSISYVPSATYFYSYTEQIHDAYEMFLQIGQQA